MYVVVFKGGTPLCIKVGDGQLPDPLLAWESREDAVDFMLGTKMKPEDWQVVEVTEYGIHNLAKPFKCKVSEIRFQVCKPQ